MENRKSPVGPPHRCLLGIGVGLALSCLSVGAKETVSHIGYVFPAGGRQGSTLTVRIGGENVYGVQSALVSGSGVEARVTDSRDPEAGQMDRKRKNRKRNEAVIDEVVTLKITIAPDAQPGPRDICLAGTNMMSNKLIFQVGELRETAEVEPNNTIKSATPVGPLPAVVQGQILPGDVDRFRFSAVKGQRLVVDVSARALLPYIADGVPGWFQAIVAVTDAAGKELAVSGDFQFRQDPVLFFDVPADGDYVLSIRDTIYRGREDFVYRVRIGELPFITSIFPLGALAGTHPVPVRVTGVNLPTNTVLVAPDPSGAGIRSVSVTRDGLFSNSRSFEFGTVPELERIRPALKLSRARKVDLPVVVNGCIAAPGEKHYYRFNGKAGQVVCLEVMARRLGSPLDSCLVLLDGQEKKIAENDEIKDKGEGFITHQADSGLTCVLPADGSYTVMLYDVQGKGGEGYGYRLRIGSPVPDFTLRMTPAALTVPKGGSAPITIQVIRRDGFEGDIQLALRELKQGVRLDAARIPAGVDRVMTTISSAPSASGRFAPRLYGTASVAGHTITRQAVPAETLMQAFLYQHLFPFQELTLLVSPRPAPFRVIPGIPAGEVLTLPLGKETTIPLSVSRQPGYTGPIKLQLMEAPKGVTVRNGYIPAQKDSFLLTVRVESKVETNSQGNLIFTGSMPVEREATAEEKQWMAAKAARELEARKAAAVGVTNAPPAPSEAGRGGGIPVEPRGKPVMVTRPVVMVFPAVPFRIVERAAR